MAPAKTGRDSPPLNVELWMPVWIGDYLADTIDLSTSQHGAYFLLLMAYWRQGPLPDDAQYLARIVRTSEDEWQRTYRRTVLERFFWHDGDRWRHHRQDAQLEKAIQNRESLRQRSARANEARWAKHRVGGKSARTGPAQREGSDGGNTSESSATDPQGHPQGDLQGDPHGVHEQSPSPQPPPSSSSVAKATAAFAARPRSLAGAAPTTGGSVTDVPVSTDPAPIAAPTDQAETARRRRLWRCAKEHLMELDGLSREHAGTFLGQLNRNYPRVVVAAIEAATAEGKKPAIGFRDYLTAVCQHMSGDRESLRNRQAELEAGNDAVREAFLRNLSGRNGGP